MVMAYIIFVNPAILSFAGIPPLQGQGPSFAATQAATCLVAGVLTIAMGLVTNYPLALASGMGLNAVVAFQLVAGMKLPWTAAMGVVLLEGLVITVLVLTGFREAIMNAIPAGAQARHRRRHRPVHPLHRPRVGGHREARPARRAGDPRRSVVGAGGGGPVRAPAHPVAHRAAVERRAPGRHPREHRARGGGERGHRRTRVPDPGAGGVAEPRSWRGPDFSSLGGPVSTCPSSRRVGVVTALVVIFSIMLSDFFDTMGTVIGIGGEAGWLTPGRAAAAARPGAAGGLARRGGGRRGGGLVGHHLHRVGGGRGGGGAQRARLGGDRPLLPARAVLRARSPGSCRPRPPRRP